MLLYVADPMITDALQRIANQRESLTREEARTVMTEVFSGTATDAQIAALLVALHMKGETVEEIVGFAEAIRAAAEPLPLHQDSTLSVSSTGRDTLVDTCGTGGDARGQARQPRVELQMRLGRRYGSLGHKHWSSRCRFGQVSRRSRHRVLVCAGHAFRH